MILILHKIISDLQAFSLQIQGKERFFMADQDNKGMPGRPPMPPMPGFPGFPEDNTEVRDVLKQVDKFKWRDNPPKVLRGDAREAFKCASAAEGMECDCWNARCPYHGNCRKCIVFHMCLKQFPTCQRAMLTELHLNDLLDEELHINRDTEA